MKFDPQKHHRRSIRLQGYNYSQAGAYFVTIVAWQREILFGEILNGETPQGGDVVLNDFGKIIQEEWEQTAVIRPNVELGEYVVMPNHFHGILVFTNDDAYTVGATRRVAPTKTKLQSGSLGAVIGQFKSIVTKRINRLRGVEGVPVWQRNYYEHIIRNESEMDRISRYIESNPMRWADDDENPNHVRP
jgi:REP element-mobilizing transposase RayT